MQVGDTVAIAVAGWRAVIKGTICDILEDGKVEIEYYLPGSTYTRVSIRHPSEVIVLKD